MFENASVDRDAWRLLNPDNAAAAEAAASAVTQEERFGGSEAMPVRVMRLISEPTAAAASTFLNQALPRRSTTNISLPGQTPWRAFNYASQLIIALWFLSFLWTVWNLVFEHGYAPKPDQIVREDIHRPHQLLTSIPFSETNVLWRTACGGRSNATQQTLQPGLVQQQPQRWRRLSDLWTDLRISKSTTLIDRDCGLERMRPLDMSTACWSSGNATKSSADERCVAVFLLQGGRSANLCEVRKGNRSLAFNRLASLRLLPGVPALQSLAASFSQTSTKLQGSAKVLLKELRLFGRAAECRLQSQEEDDQESDVTRASKQCDSVLAFRIQGKGSQRFNLVPEFEVDAPVSQNSTVVNIDRSRERLIVVNDALVSLTPTEDEVENGCSGDKGSLHLSVWDLKTGERARRRILPVAASPSLAIESQFDVTKRPSANEALNHLQALCSSTSPATEVS
eukprot:TRINITY_DN23507_c1_g1_i2.p1 TRINITY_DN23507_c1_g1~~TRINITY_DN23507_c1_g1_i2.p1  ORF type:complete len:453 (-),score=55.82 TRINITY_DN23507_c1_g1_i2:236-1594(-)